MRVLVRRPSPRLDTGEVTHIERSLVDAALAATQWQTYVDTVEAHGWQIVEVPADDARPDGVFIEDAIVMFGEVAVITNPGAESRKLEIVSVEPVASELGCRIERIVAPGTLDGGDVLKVGSVVYVGCGGRTNAAGISQLAAIVEPLEYRVVTVALTKVLHLKSAVTALPDETVIGWEPSLDSIEAFPKFLPVLEQAGAHVVLIGGNKLLMSTGAPRSAAMFAAMGYEPVIVDISEFEKLEGCVTCLSVRVR